MTVLTLMRETPMCGTVIEKKTDRKVVANVYSILKRLEESSAIERMPTFQPEFPEEKRSRPKVYYRITAQGLKMLNEAKAALQE